MIVNKFGDMHIISKTTNKEECSISYGCIEFKPSIDYCFINNDLDNISIDMGDKFKIKLHDFEENQIKFNVDNINNIRPYTFDFIMEINDLLYKVFIDDAYIDRNNILNNGYSELYLKTRADSKLTITRINTIVKG